MEAVQTAVESACLILRQQDGQKTKHAEEVLLEFRRSSKPIPACIHILQNSGMLEACFQAAITLREAALEGWALLDVGQKAELRRWILQYLLQAGSNQEQGVAVVLKTLLGAYASIAKRQWLELDATERQAVFQEACSLASDQGDLQKVHVGMSILEALVFEFSPPTSSRMAMPWAFHAECGCLFQAENLIPAFQLGASVAAASAGHVLESPAHAMVCSDAVSLMNCVLNWDYSRVEAGRFSAGRFGFSHAVNRQDSKTIAPGRRWREALLVPPHGDWLLHLLPQVAKSQDMDELGARCRTLVVQLSSLTGDVFPSAQEDTTLKPAHIARCVAWLMVLASPHEELLRAAQQAFWPEPLLDCCKAIHALCNNFTMPELQAALGPSIGAFLAAVSHLAEGCIWCGGVDEDCSDEWQGVATGLLLESWTCLLQKQRSPGVQAPPLPALEAGTVSIFRLLVDAYMKDLVAGADDDCVDDAAQASGREWSDEVIERVASLARASLPVSLPLLHSLLASRLQALREGSVHGDAGGERLRSETLEQMWWLVQLAAHTLADSGRGETPQVPADIIALCESPPSSGDAVDSARSLSQVLCEVASLCVDENGRRKGSPRLFEAAIGAVARWLDTYVEAPEYVPEECEVLALGYESSVVLEQMLQIVISCLSNFPGEVELHRVTLEHLLHVLVVRWPRCKKMWALQSWQALCNEFATFDGPLFQLRSRQQRQLARCLCTASAAVLAYPVERPSAGSAVPFYQHLLQPTLEHVRQLVNVASSSGEAAVQQAVSRADVVDKIVCALERIRGSLEGAGPALEFALFDTLQSFLHPLARLQHIYPQHSLISRQLFKLASTLVDTHVGFLPGERAEALACWCLGLLVQYREVRGGLVSAATTGGGTAAQSEQSEQVSEMSALLKLLINLTQRFDDDITDSLTEVVVEGMNILLPMFTQEMLQHPKLSEAYFRLLLQVCEVHPGKVAALPERHSAPLVQSLHWALENGDSQARSRGLGALAALAAFHLGEVRAHRPGFSQLRLPDGNTVFGHFLQAILKHLLNDAAPQHVTDMAADALLPMILSESSSFVQTAQCLLGSQAEESVRAAIAGQLEELVAGLDPNAVNGAALTAFRKRLHMFVAHTRGIVHKK